jgi:hypothetical protein
MKVLHILALAVMDFICGLAFLFGIFALMSLKSGNEIYVIRALLWVLAAFVVWITLILIFNKNIKTGRYTVFDAALINMVVRVVLIPIYLVVFIICLLFSITGPFAIGVWVFAFLIDSFILFMTNLMSIPCCVALRRSNVFSTGVSVLLFLCQFIFCVDIVVAVIYLAIAKSAENKIASKV